MADNWDKERRKVWGLLLELKRKIKELESKNEKSETEEPPSAAEA